MRLVFRVLLRCVDDQWAVALAIWAWLLRLNAPLVLAIVQVGVILLLVNCLELWLRGLFWAFNLVRSDGRTKQKDKS